MRDKPLPTGFGFPLGFAAAIAVTIGAVAAGATRQPGWSVAALVLVVAAAAVLSTPLAVLGTALVSWALHDGFVLGRGGDLVFTRDSALAAAVLAGTALLGAALARLSLLDNANVPAQRTGPPVLSGRSSGAGAYRGTPAPPRGGPPTRRPWRGPVR
ncbi:hypothetical protein [Amycolatopsis sp.]|uniref:hypothetical protein n=1 Tax=Amycolatopsis sp. TaxID=37632 RepID=UPI002CEBB35A|nr:hypothetical protein [Amycolatopsis sp.]HVV14705.1 hypothetical protein [Amycolatopsis sp.]